MKTKQRTELYKIITKLPRPLKDIFVEIIYLVAKRDLMKAKTPLSINLFVTDNCNLKCSHCFYAGHLNKNDKLSLEHIKAITKSLRNPPVSVVLTGGETFLRQDLTEICILLDKIHTKKIILATNGTLPERIYKTVKDILSKTDLDVAVQISLDGPLEIHDKIRGVPGTFKKLLSTLEELKTIKNKKLTISVSTTISKKNCDYIAKTIEEVKKLKVFHGLQFVRSANKHVFNIDKEVLSDFDSEDNTLTIKQMEDLQELIKARTDNDDPLLNRTINLINKYFIRVLKSKKRFMSCTAGYVDAVIYPNGDVSICEFTKPFANLKDYNWDFYKLWTSDKAKEIRQKTKFCVCTHQCNLLNSLRYDKKSIVQLFKDEKV